MGYEAGRGDRLRINLHHDTCGLLMGAEILTQGRFRFPLPPEKRLPWPESNPCLLIQQLATLTTEQPRRGAAV